MFTVVARVHVVTQDALESPSACNATYTETIHVQELSTYYLHYTQVRCAHE